MGPGPSAPTRDWARVAIAVLFAYFAAKLVYFAVALSPSVPPDEVTHFGRVLAYAEVWGIPASAPSNWELGLLAHRPFLYSWLMGRLLAFNVFPVADLTFLRLANALIALFTVSYGLRFVRLLTSDKITHVVFVLLLTNTLMFTGISGAVSYDNLANLAAAACIFYLFRFAEEAAPTDLVAFVGFAAAGCLAKRSFLPLAAILTTVLVIRAGRRLPEVARLVTLRSAATATAAALVLANAALYGGNLVRYQRLVPGFEQVVGVTAALENRIFARDYVLDGFREGLLSYEAALATAERIEHDPDRRSTKLQLAQSRKRGDWRVSPARYAQLWGRIMLDRTVGYFGHQVIRRTGTELAAYAIVLGLSVLLHLIAWRGGEQRGASWAGAIAVAYLAILLALVNYPTYVEKGLLDAGVQGRYLFPVLVPLLAFVASGLSAPRSPALRLATCGAASALFLYGEFPTYLLRATAVFTEGLG